MVEQNRSGAYTEIVYAPGGQKLALTNGQTLQKAFVPLPANATAVYTSTGLDHYRHADWLGSARMTSTPTRTVSSTTAYAPFGETYAQSGSSDLSFTGQNSDTSSGVYDFMFREYGTQGRWPSPDPAGLAAVNPSYPQSWNRYAYVMNNPLAYIDRSGLACVYLTDSGDEIESIDFNSDEGECAGNGGIWIDPVNTTVYVNGGSDGGFGSGLPPSGCADYYQDGIFLGTQCGNSWTPASSQSNGQRALTMIHDTLSNFPTVCGKVGLFASADIAGYGAFATLDDQGHGNISPLAPVNPYVALTYDVNGNLQPIAFYGEGAGALYEPPSTFGGYLGFNFAWVAEGAVGGYIEKPSIAGAYQCPP